MTYKYDNLIIAHTNLNVMIWVDTQSNNANEIKNKIIRKNKGDRFEDNEEA